MTAISLPRVMRIAPGALNDLPAALTQLGLRSPAVLTDAFLAGNGALARLLAILKSAGCKRALTAKSGPIPPSFL